MDIKDLLLVLRSDGLEHRAAAVAASLAREHEARLHARCVVSFSPTPAECFAVGPAADSDVLERAEREWTAVALTAETALRAALGRSELLHDCRAVEDVEARYVLPSMAQCCDLVVIAHDAPQRAQERRLTEEILVRSGAPCLLVPDDPLAAKDFSTVVVAWNGTAAAKRSIEASLPLLKAAKEVHIAVVDDPARLDQHNDEGAMAERLSSRSIRCIAHRLAGRQHHAAGPLIDLCNDRAADLLVMGAFSHPQLWEALFGGTSRGALARAGLPVLMSH